MSQEQAAQVGRSARRAARSPALERAARAGFAASGLVHLLVAYLALRVAWSGGGERADQSGALSVLAENPFGQAVLWLTALGCAALALWQVADVVLETRGERDRPGRTAKDRAVRIAKGVGVGAVYTVLAVSAARFAVGEGRSSSSQSKGLTARLLEQPGGRVLVVLVGVVVVVVGGYHCYKGLTRGFLDDLRENPGPAVVRLAVVGHVAKGVALVVVGLLFCLAGVRRSPGEAGGLDTALKTLRDAPAGPYLLTAVALGIAAYGVYMFARARYARL
jgi:hypothetical protein